MAEGTLTYVLLVFVAVFLLSQALIIPAFGESRKARKRLRKRLIDIDQMSQDESIASLLRERYLRRLAPWERRFEAMPGLEALSRQIEQSGNSVLAYRLILLAAGMSVAGLLLGWSVTRMPLAAIAIAAVAAWLPFLKISYDRNRRFNQFEEQLPDAIDIMRRALLAGHPFGAALKLVADDTQDPIAREFELTFADINYGNDVRRAMLGLLARVPSVTVMAFVTSVLVQKETGGNLAEILDQISKVIRDRFRFQRRVRTLSAEGRLSAWILVMVPMVLIPVLLWTSPDYLPMLFNDPFGQQLVYFAFIWGAIGILILRKIIRIEV
jgi:tight adherence protein B